MTEQEEVSGFYSLLHQLSAKLFCEKETGSKSFKRAKNNALEILLTHQQTTKHSSVNITALTDLFSLVSRCKEERDQIDDYQLVPEAPRARAFDRISGLIEELDDVVDLFSVPDNLHAKTIQLLCAVARLGDDSSPDPASSQSFYCDRNLLQFSDQLFASEPGWSFSASNQKHFENREPSKYSNDLSNSLFGALQRPSNDSGHWPT